MGEDCGRLQGVAGTYSRSRSRVVSGAREAAILDCPKQSTLGSSLLRCSDGCQHDGQRLRTEGVATQGCGSDGRPYHNPAGHYEDGCGVQDRALESDSVWAASRLYERAKKLGASEPEHYLFPVSQSRHTQEGKDVAGTGYDPESPMKTWRTAWRSLTAKAGLRGLRFHDLRHHGITKLAEAGVPDQTLMSIAGHISRQMLNHYSHICMKAKQDAVKAIDSPPPNEHAAEGGQAVN